MPGAGAGRGPATQIAHKTCNLCEAMCGLRIHLAGRELLRVEADPEDPFSRGAICPKAVALKEIQEDPDRLRTPLRRRGSGATADWEEISWEQALGETAERLAALQARHGNDAVASYLGNPGAHSLGVLLALPVLGSVLDTRNRCTASSLDQNPKHASSILLFGNFLSIPIPDVDRTDFFLVLGANPVVSGGSLMSAAGMRRRLRALRERGGRLVVVDPRRSETAEMADEHLAIHPGRDALLLAALLHTVLDEKLGGSSEAQARGRGLETLAGALEPFSPEAVASRLGFPAERVRGLARAFCDAPSAVCYGRVGTCQTPFGTLNSWLIDVLNLLTGNLDRPGGAMFPKPAADVAAVANWRGSPGHLAQWHSRVRGAACFNGELPTACLSEEITTPGPGQVRGLLAIAGNPVLSAPGGAALGEALAGLEFFAAVDFYLNETTRHAHIILPASWSLEHDNYELLFHGFAVRNTARFSPAVLPAGPDQRDDYQILAELALRLAEHKQPKRWKRAALALVRKRGWLPSQRRLLDAWLRVGPYGDGFRPWRRGLRLADLERAPSGLDLGPLTPRLDEVLVTADGAIDLAPDPILEELQRLECEAGGPAGGLSLIGRRDMRSNNSWLHNTRMATRGRERCTVQLHPDDAQRLGLEPGRRVRVESRSGSVEAPLELSERLRPGVVSLPHGWGHRGQGLRMRTAESHAGVSCNDVVDPQVLEPVTGNAVFNGVPVRVVAAEPAAAGSEAGGGFPAGNAQQV